MATDRVERKLEAILAADMVGYSRLMEADERGAIARKKAHRQELINPEIAAHDGRIDTQKSLHKQNARGD